MTMEEYDNGTGGTGSEAQPPAGESSCCGPACGCGTNEAGGGRKLKIAVCLAVAVAVCAILVYKTMIAGSGGSSPGGPGSSTGAAGSGPGWAADGSAPCNPLPSIAALNTMAADRDSVFILVPGKDDAPPANETERVLAAVERTLAGKGVRTARYALRPDSPDYGTLAARLSPPGIAVLTRGKGIGTVSGAVTETSLMQAYVASSGGGSCCPPGGAPSSGKCP